MQRGHIWLHDIDSEIRKEPGAAFKGTGGLVISCGQCLLGFLAF